MKPITSEKAPQPDILKSFCITGSKSAPKKPVKPVSERMFAPIIKGKRDGITLLNQRRSPFFDAAIISLGNNIIKTLKIAINIGIIYVIEFFEKILFNFSTPLKILKTDFTYFEKVYFLSCAMIFFYYTE